MSRPIRIEFPNALYHVTSRGDRREDIFEDDDDRHAFLKTLGEVVEQFNWLCYAWCLMDNHYHLLIETNRASLSDDRLGSGRICQDQECRTAALS